VSDGPGSDSTMVERVGRLFEHTFDAAADGVWSAPGRVNLIGEHTDYNAGLCLPIALPQRTFAAVRRRGDGLLRMVSDLDGTVVEVELSGVAPDRPGGWSAYVAGVPWALREAGYAVESGFDVAVTSAVPVGAGLSSSAALECAMGAAVSDLAGLGLLADDDARGALAAACVNAENTIAQAPTGGMDQSASMLGQSGHALLLDCRDGSHEQVPFDLASAGLSLLVVDTRAEHALVDGQYAERRASCEQAARELGVPTLREVSVDGLDSALSRLSSDLLRKRARHVVTEIDRVVQARETLRRGDFDELGRLFLQSHASMRDDFEISVDELDTVVETAVAAGALGARMTGGGFGGSAIALVREDAVDEVTAAVTEAFSRKGFRAPNPFAVTAADSAHRDT